MIRQFKGNDRITMYEFCQANNISINSFRSWIRQYESGGLEALARKDKSLPDILPEGMERSEENYKRVILQLRIENERLKKNYTVQTTPDGGQVYIRLKEKSTQ